ncbi:hypothetical protein ALSL_0446 [Aerosticca soli]|uniref:Uncharacterized protein n=1 Tax=Aerosticca soli TaxID=2010829 RepID=A0A2Z6E2E0_9GAMM|nr:hypothetical protein ALSL_0446 [Aerosticca soli]
METTARTLTDAASAAAPLCGEGCGAPAGCALAVAFLVQVPPVPILKGSSPPARPASAPARDDRRAPGPAAIRAGAVRPVFTSCGR